MKARILMVDDTPANLLALEAVLENPEYELIRANSGSDALEALHRYPDVAVILLDVQMPILDGFETARRIKDNPASAAIPIIFITAVYTADPFVLKGLKAGGVDYFTKPFDPEVLKLKVSICASFRQKADPLREREQQIRESEEVLRATRKLASMLEPLPVGIIVANAFAQIGLTNEELLKILKLTNVSRSDSYGQFLIWWQNSGSVLRGPHGPLMRALEGGSTYNEDVSISCFDGTRKSVFVGASPLCNLEGHIVGAVLILQDATERRKIGVYLNDRIRRLISVGVELEESVRLSQVAN